MSPVKIPIIPLKPDAIARISGNTDFPHLKGTIMFYALDSGGILIQAEVFNLPDRKTPNGSGFFGMHIHQFGNCTPPFDKTGEHFNPLRLHHPEHAGDLPPLLSNNGYAWTAFFDNRFRLSGIIGKSVVIHGNRDDFTSQPSGNSGPKIGCGVIEAVRRTHD